MGRFGSRAQILAAIVGASPYHAATFNPLPKDRPMRPNFLKLLPILALAAPALAPAQTTFTLDKVKASGQITLRKVDGWQTIAEPLAGPIDLAA